METATLRLRRAVATAAPRALTTIVWIVRLTATVSLVVFLMQYTGLLRWLSALVQPLFAWFGLPGEAATAFVSGYCVNTYASIAVISTLDLSTREMTILATMITAAHAVFVEGAVLRKTGTPALYSILLRTAAACALGWSLNLLLPGRPAAAVAAPLAAVPLFELQGAFLPLFRDWLAGIVRLSLLMGALIFALNILQRLLYEFGVMERFSRLLAPLLRVFGLPAKCSFLWIVANVIGLSYGSAAMLDEVAHGNLSRRDILLLNTHIGISHSNLEDLALYASFGAVWYVVLLARWVLVTLLVRLLRLFL